MAVLCQWTTVISRSSVMVKAERPSAAETVAVKLVLLVPSATLTGKQYGMVCTH